MKIGFIGLGIMGQPMALNLLKGGFDVTVYNRTTSRTVRLQEAGASVARTPEAVARIADVVITIVSDTQDVEDVLFSDRGVVEGMSPDNVVIDMSTISPSSTVQFAKRLKDKGVHMLDAPVSGGEKGAIEGTLSIMVGGEAEIFERCEPILKAMGGNIVLVGKNGDGQMTKACNQIAGALHVVAMCEALNLARASGLNLQRVLDAVSKGAAGSWMLSNLGPRILENDFTPGFMIKLQTKDLRLAVAEMDKFDVRGDASRLAHQMFSEATARGYGDRGTQGLFEAINDDAAHPADSEH